MQNIVPPQDASDHLETAWAACSNMGREGCWMGEACMNRLQGTSCSLCRVFCCRVPTTALRTVRAECSKTTLAVWGRGSCHACLHATLGKCWVTFTSLEAGYRCKLRSTTHHVVRTRVQHGAVQTSEATALPTES